MINRSSPTFYESNINNYILNTNILKGHQIDSYYRVTCLDTCTISFFCFGRFNFILIKMGLIKSLDI